MIFGKVENRWMKFVIGSGINANPAKQNQGEINYYHQPVNVFEYVSFNSQWARITD